MGCTKGPHPEVRGKAEPRRPHYPPIALPIAVEALIITLLALLPKAVTEVMIARNTRAQIRPYSMAVAPRSSRQNLFR